MVPHRMKNPLTYPAGRDRQPTRPLRGSAVRRIRNVTRATPSCRHASGGILIQIDARFSSCLPRSSTARRERQGAPSRDRISGGQGQGFRRSGPDRPSAIADREADTRTLCQYSERSVRLLDQMELALEAAAEDEITAERAVAKTTTVAGFTCSSAGRPSPASLMTDGSVSRTTRRYERCAALPSASGHGCWPVATAAGSAPRRCTA